jgi:multicomponent Na+:H+ antiporter subunit B
MSEVFIIDLLLLLLVGATAVAIVQVRSLFSATMLAGIYSLLMAVVWSNMHALDVAFTEAAVGAGISTILLVGTLVRTKRLEKKRPLIQPMALLVCVVTGLALGYGTLDMPRFGDPEAPIHVRRVPKLFWQNVGKLPQAPPRHYHHEPGHPQDDYSGHVPNTVTTLLGAYRGYDTMYETTVIFTAGISMVLLLRRRRDHELEPDPELDHAQRASEEQKL